jgi:hypothetical protein
MYYGITLTTDDGRVATETRLMCKTKCCVLKGCW